MNVSAINQREIIRGEIKSYEESKYIQKCLDNFSKDKTKTIRNRDVYEKSHKTTKDKCCFVKTYDSKFIKKIIVSIVVAFVFIACAISIKSNLFVKQHQYNTLVSETKIIQAENEINESKILSYTTGPAFFKKVEELGMIKYEKKIYINSNEFKSQYNKNNQNNHSD